MSLTNDGWWRLRSRVSPSETQRQIDEELSEHLDTLARDFEARGFSPASARREARKRFGDVRKIRKELYGMETRRVRKQQRSAYFDGLRQDLRFGVRQLVKKPTFTLIVIGTLAIGIGANAAIFSVLKGVFLDPLPYDEPERLTFIFHGETDGSCCGPLSGPDFLDFRQMSETFEDIAVMSNGNTNLTGDGDPEVVLGARISASMLNVLHVQPARGRAFTPDDELGDTRVVILSDGLWRNRLGADPNVVGSTIELNRASHTVVGVLPPTSISPLPRRNYSRKGETVIGSEPSVG
jgi:hypothetical protein